LPSKSSFPTNAQIHEKLRVSAAFLTEAVSQRIFWIPRIQILGIPGEM
jgi:hypothetical protein